MKKILDVNKANFLVILAMLIKHQIFLIAFF